MWAPGLQEQGWVPGVFNVRTRPRLFTITSPWILSLLHTRNRMLVPLLLPSLWKRTRNRPLDDVTLMLGCVGSCAPRMAFPLRGCCSWPGSA